MTNGELHHNDCMLDVIEASGSEHRIGQAKGSKRQFESGLNAIFTDARNISVQMVQDAQSYA